MTHCWEDGPTVWDDDLDKMVGSTCMLWDGHDGEHAFVLDTEIGVTFEPSEAVDE